MFFQGRRAARWLVTLLAILASGCATNTITGRSQFMLVSEASAISGSASAYASMIGQLAKKNKVETGTPRAERVREITNRLIAQAVRFRPDSAAWNWEVRVIDDPKVVNAFCMAGGKMGIYTGMWEKLKATDDEIANVMGHEIGHALASHTREKMSVAITVGVGTAMVAAAASSRSSDPTAFNRTHALLGTAAALAVTLPNSREAETEADQIGIELAARAGFDPAAAITLWQKMAKEGGTTVEFLSTHPSPENRMQRLESLIAKVEPLYRLAREGGATAPPPAFIGTAANERPVEVVSREEYAARLAEKPEVMTFVSEEFDRFRRGEVVFECTTECVFGYAFQRTRWKELHGRKAWRDLAVAVMKVGYANDLSYFLLGEAAAGLKISHAARTYYERALAAHKAGRTCSGGFDTCEGFDIARSVDTRPAK